MTDDSIMEIVMNMSDVCENSVPNIRKYSLA